MLLRASCLVIQVHGGHLLLLIVWCINDLRSKCGEERDRPCPGGHIGDLNGGVKMPLSINDVLLWGGPTLCDLGGVWLRQ